MSPEAQEFLLASIRRDRRRRRRSVAVLSTLLIIALIATGSAVVQQQVSQDRQRLSTARLLLARADATLAADPRIALRLAAAANRIHPDRETQAGLVGILVNLRGLDADRADPMERACSISGGGLNSEEWARYIPDMAYVDSCPP